MYKLINTLIPLDINGATELKLGNMQNSTYLGENKYWVFVEGSNTTCLVTSQGTNSIREYFITIR